MRVTEAPSLARFDVALLQVIFMRQAGIRRESCRG